MACILTCLCFTAGLTYVIISVNLLDKLSTVANRFYRGACNLFIYFRVTPACALTFVVYESVIHFLMPLS